MRAIGDGSVHFLGMSKMDNKNIIITTDMTMSITKCFETYQIRWSIEVLAKESKQYLGLGRYQGRNFDGQIADCTLCHINLHCTCLDKRINDYETMGVLFELQRAAVRDEKMLEKYIVMDKALEVFDEAA